MSSRDRLATVHRVRLIRQAQAEAVLAAAVKDRVTAERTVADVNRRLCAWTPGTTTFHNSGAAEQFGYAADIAVALAHDLASAEQVRQVRDADVAGAQAVVAQKAAASKVVARVLERHAVERELERARRQAAVLDEVGGQRWLSAGRREGTSR